jgi:hypothetical protein
MCSGGELVVLMAMCVPTMLSQLHALPPEGAGEREESRKRGKGSIPERKEKGRG